jgi:hypothetical protein
MGKFLDYNPDQAYARRKAIVEPVNRVLKEQRGMRRFRMCGLQFPWSGRWPPPHTT